MLITGANAPGTNGTCWSLLQRNLFNSKVELFGADSQVGVRNEYFSEVFVLPPASSQEYLEKLYELCQEKNIDLVVPQTSAETMILGSSDLNGLVAEVLLIQPRELIQKLSSKAYTYEAVREIGMTLDNFQICYNLPEVLNFIRNSSKKDFFLKDSNLSGGRGIVRVVEDVSMFLTKKPHSYHLIPIDEIDKAFNCLRPENGVIVQEMCEGTEFSIDCYRDKQYNLVIPRTRDLIRAGISQITTTKNIRNLIDFASIFAEYLQIEGVFGLQCILNQNDEIAFLECNPRIQGSMVTSTIAGENLIGRAARQALHLSQMPQNTISWGARFQRSWSGLGETDGKYFHI